MPIYEYVCDECKSRFERIVTAKTSEPECPKCGSHRSTVQFSTFAAHTGNGASSTADSSDSTGTCGCTPHSCCCQ
jgi:putative FmdB family regulatory protein